MHQIGTKGKFRSGWLIPTALGFALVLVLLVGISLGWLNLFPTTALAGGPVTRYVAPGGDDTANTCDTMGSPCATIQHALNNAVAGDTILVAGGTYTENLTIPVSSTIMGGYEPISWTQDTTMYPSAVDGSSGGFVVALVPGISVTLNGLSLVNSVPDIIGDGGGINVEASSLTLKQVKVMHNQSNGDGGGMYASDAKLMIYDSEFSHNTAPACCGGLHLGNGSHAMIMNTTIYSNTAGNEAGGIGLFFGSVLTMTNSTIDSNVTTGVNGQAGGLLAMWYVTTTLESTQISNNQTADHGGGLVFGNYGHASLTNMLMFGNASSAGPASTMVLGDFDVEVMNTTIADNNPPPNGHQAIIVWSGGELTITNSIMWNNAWTIDQDPPCAGCVNVSYSVMEGGYTGTMNLDADPMFMGNGDYRLSFGSPAIDSGTDMGAPLLDFNGNTRPVDGNLDGTAGVDMGAFEAWWYTVYLPMSVK